MNGVLQGTGGTFTYTHTTPNQCYTLWHKVVNSLGNNDSMSVVVTVPYSVAMQGPTTVRSGNSCTWTAQPTGGYLPLTYGWYKNGVLQSGSNSATWVGSFSSTGNLYVKITDNQGKVTSSATQTITVSAGAPLCGA